VRNRARDLSHAHEVKFVAPEVICAFCESPLWIVETRVRHVQTLEPLLRVVLKGKKCSSGSCAHTGLRYRPPEEGRLVLKAHEFGLDVVILAGEKHLRDEVSIPRIHKSLHEERGIPICERSVGNLIDDYVALCECVAGDTDRLRTRLKGQGAIVLSVDGVQYDDRSPVLYVQRDVMSGEVLYAGRRLARAAEDLIPMLERSRDLARDISVPIIGIVSDKERSLVPAIAKVFPDIPHEYCHQHYRAPHDEIAGRRQRPHFEELLHAISHRHVLLRHHAAIDDRRARRVDGRGHAGGRRERHTARGCRLERVTEAAVRPWIGERQARGVKRERAEGQALRAWPASRRVQPPPYRRSSPGRRRTLNPDRPVERSGQASQP
jgi:hypothetical protein